MKNILYLLALITMLFISCKKEANVTEEVVLQTPINTKPTPTQTPQPAQYNASGANTNSIMYAQPSGSGTATGQNYTTTAVPTTIAKGMNPPHGQPGHRCDISVGAPLNSPPGKTAAPVSTTNMTVPQTPTQTQTQTIATNPVTTAKGMNPPHGQAGHRCDISVGAPLNSPPGKPAVATTQITTPPVTSTPITTNTVTPPSAIPATIAAPVVTAPGMNPPHGQEGHLCSVAVGAPLPK